MTNPETIKQVAEAIMEAIPSRPPELFHASDPTGYKWAYSIAEHASQLAIQAYKSSAEYGAHTLAMEEALDALMLTGSIGTMADKAMGGKMGYKTSENFFTFVLRKQTKAIASLTKALGR